MEYDHSHPSIGFNDVNGHRYSEEDVAFGMS